MLKLLILGGLLHATPVSLGVPPPSQPRIPLDKNAPRQVPQPLIAPKEEPPLWVPRARTPAEEKELAELNKLVARVMAEGKKAAEETRLLDEEHERRLQRLREQPVPTVLATPYGATKQTYPKTSFELLRAKVWAE